MSLLLYLERRQDDAARHLGVEIVNCFLVSRQASIEKGLILCCYWTVPRLGDLIKVIALGGRRRLQFIWSPR
jgi:hypothetical protein